MNTHQFASDGTSEFPSLWLFPSIWPTEKNHSTVIQKCLILMQMSQLWCKCLSRLVLLPPPFLFPTSPYTVWLSLRSETVQPWKSGTAFFICSSVWTNSLWQHLNPFFQLLSCLSHYKYLQNREFGSNIAKYLQSLYVWGAGSIGRYHKIF